MSRKPWEIPIQYDEPAFEPPGEIERQLGLPDPEDDDIRDGRDAEELLNRGPRDERDYECNDTAPIDYGRGPHDEEFDCSLNGGEHGTDAAPLDYERGPHEDEFGVEDDDEE